MSRTERTELLIGDEGVKTLDSSQVLVFGCGGVGGYVCEVLVRAGVGNIDIVDNDVVSESNINRQIIATCDTIGMDKTVAQELRIKSINPGCKVRAYNCFYLPEDIEVTSMFEFGRYDYVIDAIDTVAAKIDIISRCKEAGTPVISSMGTGNKLDPSAFRIADISETKVCPLAKVIRRELRSRGIDNVEVLYSEEDPVKTGARTPGSISFVPAAAGLFIGGRVIKNLLVKER